MYSETPEKLTTHKLLPVCRWNPIDLPWGGMNTHTPLQEGVRTFEPGRRLTAAGTNKRYAESRALLRQV